MLVARQGSLTLGSQCIAASFGGATNQVDAAGKFTTFCPGDLVAQACVGGASDPAETCGRTVNQECIPPGKGEE